MYAGICHDWTLTSIHSPKYPQSVLGRKMRCSWRVPTYMDGWFSYTVTISKACPKACTVVYFVSSSACERVSIIVERMDLTEQEKIFACPPCCTTIRTWNTLKCGVWTSRLPRSCRRDNIWRCRWSCRKFCKCRTLFLYPDGSLLLLALTANGERDDNSALGWN